MGNEGSVPSSDESEGVEYKSSSLSPSSANGNSSSRDDKHSSNSNSSNSNSNSNSNKNGMNTNDPRVMNINGDAGTLVDETVTGISERSGGSGSGGGNGGRLKVSGVFTRRSNAHNQNSTGIERTSTNSSSSNNNNDTNQPQQQRHQQRLNLNHSSTVPTVSHYQHQQHQVQNVQQQQHRTEQQHQQQMYAHHPNHQQHLQQQQQQHYHNQHQHVPSSRQQQQQYYNTKSTSVPIESSLGVNDEDRASRMIYQQHHAQHQHPYNDGRSTTDGPPFGTSSTATNNNKDKHNNNSINSINGTTAATTKKKIPGQRAGAAIINSMRHLNLSSAMHRIGGSSGRSPVHSPNRGNSKRQQQHSSRRQQQQQQQSHQQHQQVNEWETRWDEDSDEEDDDDNDNDRIVSVDSNIRQQMQQQQHHQQQIHHYNQHQQSSTILPPPETDSGYTAVTTSTPMIPLHSTQPQNHLQPPYHLSTTGHLPMMTTASSSSTTIIGTGTITSKTHLVTAVTPDPLYKQPDIDNDDGVEWDTGVGAGIDTTTTTSGDAENGKVDLTDNRPNVQQFLPLLRVLGKGSFGKVVLVQKRVGREQGSLFAMKILKKSHLVRRRQIERTRTERKVLSAVNHPFIMKLHYAFQSTDKLYLVLDYCPGGELFFHLSRFRRFPERVARFYAAELLLALGHLHKRGIIYRDLKPENVLLDADGHVKLGDFGLAKAGIRHAYEGATSMCGTPEYMAPEILAQQGHGFCVDYWGLGMLTYEMMTGLPPWYTTDRAKLFRRLRSAPLDIPPYFTPQSASFTSALLERNPRRRLGATGIRAAMENDFFKSISWRALYGRRVEAPIRPCEGWSPPGVDKNGDGGGGSSNDPSSSSQSNNHVPTDLDAATANFDNQFTRMPVETDHNENDDDDLGELHEDTFVGFTFDDNDRDAVEAAHQQKQLQSRQRTQHYAREGHQID